MKELKEQIQKRKGRGKEERIKGKSYLVDAIHATRLDAHNAEGQDPWTKAQKPRSNHDHPHDDLASERVQSNLHIHFWPSEFNNHSRS
jgi:hypothetical protein